MSDQTPEQRADNVALEIAAKLLAEGGITPGTVTQWSALIAQAIRDTEDAAYERAALLMEAGYELAGGLMSHPSAAVAIRSLRSTPSTGDKT